MIKYQKDTDHIVTLTLDMSERQSNVINHQVFEAFVPVIEHLQKEKKRAALRGVILTSGKTSFLAGGDWEYLYNTNNAQEIFTFCEGMKKFLRDLESPGVPVVAAINGNALGAGFEVALACHRRIILDQPRLKVGLPDVNLGIIPGGGSIIRLMWLLGIEQAFPVLSNGYAYAPKEARTAGLVDDLANDEKEMMQKAKDWLLSTPEGRRPWDREECAIPGGTAKDLSVARKIRNFTAQLNSQHKGNSNAQQVILEVLSEGSKVDFDTACRIESRHYTRLAQSKSCKNMIKALWFDHNSIQQGKTRPNGFGKFRPRTVGIIGAGMMGTGIGIACLERGMEVVLKDVSKLIADRGKSVIKDKLKTKMQQGYLHQTDFEQMLGRLKTTENSSDFENCDIIIEAVFENRMVKQKVTKEAEKYMDEYSIFATNTVSIPISQLAEASSRPEGYIGLHFFHPAEDVPMVEIVLGKKTSEETISRAFDFVKAIDKTPIIVKDNWGFYAARVQNTYILEGITMLQEGYVPALIENLGKQAGMPVGPLELADLLGLNLVLNYENQAGEHYGPKYVQHPAVNILQQMIEEFGRTGKKRKAGFYEYDKNEKTRLWSELTAYFSTQNTNKNYKDIKERMLVVQALEAVWCLQEGVIQSVEGANLGSIHGWGFPAFRGGVLQYIANHEPEDFKSKCKKLQKQYGQRFRMPRTVNTLFS